MERICKNCRWWKFISEDEGGFDGYGDCDCPAFQKILDRDGSLPSNLCLVATDDDMAIMTGPRFGCSHWEY